MGSLTTFLTVTVVAMAAIRLTEAQSSCASNLVPCASYLNATTRPPASCCDPIKQAVKTDLNCLCNLYKNPTLLRGFGVNVTQALNLPVLCGISGDVSACSSATAPTSSNDSPSGTTTTTTPRTNEATIASAGIFSFLLIATSMILY